MIACAALAMAAGCAGPPISAYVVPLDASVAARPNRVVFIASGDATRRLHVQTIGPSGRRRVVRGFDRYLVASRKVFAGSDQDPNFTADVEQSGRWIVVGARTTRYAYEGGEDFALPSGEVVVAGTARGRVRELQACPGRSSGGIQSLDGSRLAISSCDGSKLVVRDLARPRARSIEVPMRAISRRPLTDVTLAGGYLAVTEYGPGGVPDVGLTIRVLRWPSLDPVYTLTGARVSYSFELARDGTLVAIRIPNGEPALAPRPGPPPCLDAMLETVWLSPAEPVAHVLPGTPCEDEVSLHGDRVLVGRLVAPAAKGDVITDIALTDLRGAAPRRVLANDTPDFPPAGVRFAADGSVEVQREGCGDTLRIEFFRLRRLLAGPPAPVRCRSR
jgi:hypothetical protein